MRRGHLVCRRRRTGRLSGSWFGGGEHAELAEGLKSLLASQRAAAGVGDGARGGLLGAEHRDGAVDVAGRADLLPDQVGPGCGDFDALPQELLRRGRSRGWSCSWNRPRTWRRTGRPVARAAADVTAAVLFVCLGTAFMIDG